MKRLIAAEHFLRRAYFLENLVDCRRVTGVILVTVTMLQEKCAAGWRINQGIQMSRNSLSILSNVTATDIRTEPFPHFIIEDALPEPVYAQLAEEYPDPDVVLNGRTKEDRAYDYPACYALTNPGISPLWKDFLAFHTSEAFYRELLQLLGQKIRELHPGIERQFGKKLNDLSVDMRRAGTGHNLFNRQSDVCLECQLFVNFTEEAKVVRGPHVDRPSELFAALLYFRDEKDLSQGSDLEICRAVDPQEIFPRDDAVIQKPPPNEIDDHAVEVVSTAKYKANTLVLFLNSARSIHAVTPRTASTVARRHVNITGDLYNLQGGGMFDILKSG